ncbi:MAG: O-antigen ligase domain-containing protein, partial [Dictyoglomus sp.]|nr:O-antigen ligase domain-containing protein [Dictyoglomus sp.]MDW8189163.1 O-antigen ligase domain-containing protein [Dictyoglomus sp.]
KDNLFFGVGPGQFIYYYPRYCIKIDPNHPLALDLRSTTTTHSVYFYFLTGWGIIGSFLFFFWLFRQIYLGFKSNKNFSKILILSMIMTFIGHGLVDDIFTVHVPLLIGMLRNQNLYET